MSLTRLFVKFKLIHFISGNRFFALLWQPVHLLYVETNHRTDRQTSLNLHHKPARCHASVRYTTVVAPMAHYRASDSKREQFRRYLEQSGVLDSITSVLVALYEETDKPDNALDFIKVHLGGAGPEPADAEALRMEMVDLQQKCNLLVGENKELRNRLLQYEPSTEEGSAE
ncbi:C-Myc-binding protein [Pseudoliparis swirei]|uniref:C-Myc-binding protein n=1 Tax=Pseudoliparis swirei TaxID=2059687 RepID=UPI0024BE6A9D|nr:C-Myc-binding protein [Pseudoliparis swirei]